MLSKDAIIFGLGYLNGPKRKLSFGGDHAEMKITARARAALTELIDAGYAVEAKADDQWQNREHYRGTMQDPPLGDLAQEVGLDFFNMEDSNYTVFSKRTDPPKDTP